MQRDKRAKFVEIANKRVNRVIKEIRLISNLSNRAAYQYSEEDVKKIARALTREIESMKARFESPSSARNSEFSL